ncbi:Sensor histidine kinase RcsC [Nocardioides sp. T2.26MG-1]|uniref:response regulator n=1 Tax=Nocardioides sp. T2.26MG-1 TaxID=3041166 RepID=UPI002477436F|nr:response regulator [Nocardioides sp. T2.26MG-1]CAI9413984.1 Sensor histidine kinase RcsC [Nocardioides sp. T2.26MG-1]
MPGVDGLALARRISATPALSGTRLVLLTSGVELDPVTLRAAGVVQVLNKPVRSSALLDMLLDLVPVVAEEVATEGRPALVGEGRGRVLVVEDDRVSQMVAQGVLTQLGYRVDLAADGTEAVDAVAATAYTLVLMDCDMPVLDGFAATAEIRRRETGSDRVPIVALTAASTPEERARCRDAGMDDFLAKPLEVAELESVLERFVDIGQGPPAVDDRVVLDPERVDLLRRLGPGDGRGLLAPVAEAFDLPTPPAHEHPGRHRRPRRSGTASCRSRAGRERREPGRGPGRGPGPADRGRGRRRRRRRRPGRPARCRARRRPSVAVGGAQSVIIARWVREVPNS